jgi:hypothetical protein
MSPFTRKYNDSSCKTRLGFRHTLIAIASISMALTLQACGDNAARAQATESVDLARQAANTAADYFAKNGQLPRDLQMAGFQRHLPESMDSLAIDPADGTIIVRFKSQELAGKSLFLTPHISGQNITWTCNSDSLPADALPSGCST